MDQDLPLPVASPRRRHLVAAAIGIALALGIGGFAVGTAVNSHSTPTVRLSDAAAGDTAGTTPGPGGIAGKHGMRGHRHGSGAAGKITSVNGTSFVLTSPAGATTVHTDKSTTYSALATGSVGDAAVGSRVLVHGTPGATNSIAAQQILVMGPRPPKAPQPSTNPSNPADPNLPQMPDKARAFMISSGVAMGTVATNSNGTLTLTTSGNTVTVTTDSKTIVVRQVGASPSDVKTDAFAAVKGVPATDGSTTVTAMHVEIVPAALANSAIASLGSSGLGGFGGGFSGGGPRGGPKDPGGAVKPATPLTPVTPGAAASSTNV